MISFLPDGFPVRRRGSCVPAAYLIAKRIDPCDVVYGRVGPKLDDHTWVEAAGKIVDPTIRQFTWWRAGQPVDRVEVERKPRAEFMDLFEYEITLPYWISEAAQHYRNILAMDPQRLAFGVAAARLAS